jgi:hypothetical protein
MWPKPARPYEFCFPVVYSKDLLAKLLNACCKTLHFKVLHLALLLLDLGWYNLSVFSIVARHYCNHNHHCNRQLLPHHSIHSQLVLHNVVLARMYVFAICYRIFIICYPSHLHHLPHLVFKPRVCHPMSFLVCRPSITFHHSVLLACHYDCIRNVSVLLSKWFLHFL